MTRSPQQRRPFFQTLEDRRLLAITVNTPIDELDGSIVDGDVSLRDALAAAPAGETIDFYGSLNGGAIWLTLGELAITRPMTVDATALADGITIDALGQSRVFHVTATATLKGLTITGGVSEGESYPESSGGGILGSNFTLVSCIVTGNRASVGGGISAGGKVTIIDSTISSNTAPTSGSAVSFSNGDFALIDSSVIENVTNGSGSAIHFVGGTINVQGSVIGGNIGAGIHADSGLQSTASISVKRSSIVDNSTTGRGGGILVDTGYVSSLELTDSIVRGNSAGSHGGGIAAPARLDIVTITNSLIADNISGGVGGGVYAAYRLTLVNSTVSNNRAAGAGGGILAGGSEFNRTLTMLHSTVYGNVSDNDNNGSGSGGGIFVLSDNLIENSVISGNTDNSEVDDDVASPTAGAANVRYSIIGRDNPQTASPIINLGGSLIGTNANPIDALLGPLADNGGPTLTHALLPGSPAINAGDPAAAAGVGDTPLYDQRGVGFPRVVGGRIDMGAFESAPSASAPVFTSPDAVSVPENTTAVLTVTATDADLPPQTITFTIVGGADAAKFGLTSGGVLSFASAPDFEAPGDANGDNIYVVTVQADDGHGGTTAQTIGVSVTPVNEFAPVFTSPSAISVPQNTTFVTQLAAVDADLPPQTVAFSIVGGEDQSKFTLNAGGLSFTNPPQVAAPTDANGDNVYIVTVEASDGAGKTATQTIQVTVIALDQDFGDAPDGAPGTGPGNYQTRLIDNGPRHTVVVGLKIGASVDTDDGALQNAAANADDTNGTLPGDEDGLTNPAADLTLTVGTQPTVNVIVTNTTGAAATLFAWIDFNANGVFENSERAGAAVANGTNGGVVTVTFPTVPAGFTGTTYARFRLSTNVAAANPTGLAPNGEVEDYRATMAAVPGLSGDYDTDGHVDGGDFLAWQRTLGAVADPAGSGADGDRSGVVDAGDLQTWADHFGESGAVAAGLHADDLSESISGTAMSAASHAAEVDELFAHGDFTRLGATGRHERPEHRGRIRRALAPLSPPSAAHPQAWARPAVATQDEVLAKLGIDAKRIVTRVTPAPGTGTEATRIPELGNVSEE